MRSSTTRTSAGGIEEQQVHLQVQQAARGEEALPLHLLLGFQEEVHRPVQVVNRNPREPGDYHFLCDPPLTAQLAHRGQGVVGHEGEERALHRGRIPARAQQPRNGSLDSYALPQVIEDPGASQGAALDEPEGDSTARSSNPPAGERVIPCTPAPR